MLNKLDEIWTKIELFVVGILALSAAMIGFYGVLMRYVFVKPIGWSEEIIAYLMVWSLLIVISPVQKKQEHIKLDVIYNKYPEKVKPFIDLLILTLSLIFSIVVILYGLDIVESLLRLQQVSQSSLQIPLWIVKLSIPVGFTLLSLRLIQSIISALREIKEMFYKRERIKEEKQ